ncbi:hypothetical protein D9M72_241090 [compost metagenome]
MTEKLGLLSAKQVEAIVTTYGTIRGFRSNLEAVSVNYTTLGDNEFKDRLGSMINTLDGAGKIGKQLVADLHERARQPFLSWWGKARVIGALTLCALLVWFGASLVRVENQRYALMLGMCNADPLKILAQPECLKAVQSRTGWWWHLGSALRGD